MAKNLEATPLHQIDYLRALSQNHPEKSRMLYEFLDQYPSRKLRVMDLGSGDGKVAQSLQSFPNVETIAGDKNTGYLEQFSSTPVLHRVGLEAQALPFKDKIFDAVNASSVLHEVYSYGGGFKGVEQCVSEAARILKPGGKFFLRDIHLQPDTPYADPVELNVHQTPLFSLFIDQYAQRNRLYQHLRLSDLVERRNNLLRLPGFAAADLLNHFVYFRKDAGKVFTTLARLNGKFDSELVRIAQREMGLVLALIDVEIHEQYIYAPLNTLLTLFESNGLFPEQVTHVQREKYFQYLTDQDLLPLAGNKLEITFTKTYAN